MKSFAKINLIKKAKIALKTSLLLIILGIATGLLGGCWDSKELKNLDVVSAIALDTKGDNLAVSLEILKPNQALEFFNPKAVKYLRGSGSTVLAALEGIKCQGVKELSLPHNRLLALSSQVAALPPQAYLDYFLRSYEIRPTMRLVMTAPDGNEPVMAAGVGEFTSAWQILNILDRFSHKEDGRFVVSLQDFADKLLSQGIQPILPVVDSVVPEQPYINRLAVFKDGVLAGILTPKATQGYFWFVDKRNHSTINFEVAGRFLAAEILGSRCNFKVVEFAGKPVAKIKLQVKAALKEELLPADTSAFLAGASLARRDLEAALAKQIREEMAAAMKASAGFGSDFIGFGQKIHGQNPKLWQKLKSKPYLAALGAEIQVEVALEFRGDTLKMPQN